jgi:hypothetical protein
VDPREPKRFPPKSVFPYAPVKTRLKCLILCSYSGLHMSVCYDCVYMVSVFVVNVRFWKSLKIYTFQEYTFRNVNKIIINLNFRLFLSLVAKLRCQVYMKSAFVPITPGFKSRHEDRLFWLRIFIVFLAPSWPRSFIFLYTLIISFQPSNSIPVFDNINQIWNARFTNTLKHRTQKKLFLIFNISFPTSQ